MTGLGDRYEVAVIGGGLTGLTAAVYLARSGKSVAVLEKDSRLGGLAQTERMNGALFNLGPHAMYEGGAALRILRELGCLPDGGYASKNGMIGILQGKIVEVPADLTPEEKAEWSKLMEFLLPESMERICGHERKGWPYEYRTICKSE